MSNNGGTAPPPPPPEPVAAADATSPSKMTQSNHINVSNKLREAETKEYNKQHEQLERKLEERRRKKLMKNTGVSGISENGGTPANGTKPENGANPVSETKPSKKMSTVRLPRFAEMNKKTTRTNRGSGGDSGGATAPGAGTSLDSGATPNTNGSKEVSKSNSSSLPPGKTLTVIIDGKKYTVVVSAETDTPQQSGGKRNTRKRGNLRNARKMKKTRKQRRRKNRL